MSEIDTDVPPVIRWSPNVTPGLAAFADCNHDCRHERFRVVGRGADQMHTSLVECQAGPCKSDSIVCRAWYTVNNSLWGKWRSVWVGVRTAL